MGGCIFGYWRTRHGPQHCGRCSFYDPPKGTNSGIFGRKCSCGRQHRTCDNERGRISTYATPGSRPKRRQKKAKKCLPCHTFEENGKNKIGPNLWNVLGRTKANQPDFPYSSSLAGIGGTWNYDALDDFLTSPKEYAPGTKMAFPGIKKPAVRANIIIYLRTLSEAPIALPSE